MWHYILALLIIISADVHSLVFYFQFKLNTSKTSVSHWLNHSMVFMLLQQQMNRADKEGRYARAVGGINRENNS